MKRRLFPAVVLALLPTVAYPQGATAPVKVTVQSDATLTPTGNTSFGTVGNTARTVTINPLSPAPDQSTALFTASGTPNANVIVTFDPATDLCLETSACTVKIVFTPSVVGSPGPDEQFRAPAISDGATVRLNAAGNFYLWLGGSIETVANQAAGVYTGVFSMRVAYQ